MRTIDLNCDLGEYGDDGAANDLALLEIVTSANIGCGGHAGDERSMMRTVEAAIARGVALGAHPSYPDRENFGRVAVEMPLLKLKESIAMQTAALQEIAVRLGSRLRHVKPHGALYHAAMTRREIAVAVANGVAQVDRGLILVGLLGAPALDVWQELGFNVAAEAFADRRYEPDGSLRSRSLPDAMITEPVIAAEQAVRLATQGVTNTTSLSATTSPRVDTLCVHSDTPNAVRIASAVRDALQRASVRVGALSADHIPRRKESD